MKEATPEDPGSPADRAVQNAPAQAQGNDVAVPPLITADSTPGQRQPHPTPSGTQSWDGKASEGGPTALGRAVLDWSGVLIAGALILVPLWMLLGNSAVLGGHPALPILLSAALALGLLWIFVLLKRSTLLERWSLNQARKPPRRQETRRTASRWQLLRGLAGRLAALGLVAGLAWLNPFPYQPSGADGQTTLAFGGEEQEPRPEKMPMIVVIIDEFADLMMVASKEVEANVARIAAKARAAGIHLIVATQRPSVDVITGTIKNNFPSRIAFQVTSDMDSRTILDKKGAKQLLGMGDMLYMDRGKEPRRVHGAYVSEAEIEKVVNFVKKQAKPAYDLSITSRVESSDDDGEEDKNVDPLYDKAVSIVAEKGKVSTSMIQRHLSVGYNRAAKLVDAMESEGVIGPPNGSKPRDVYISAA